MAACARLAAPPRQVEKVRWAATSYNTNGGDDWVCPRPKDASLGMRSAQPEFYAEPTGIAWR
mgnify:CR=1 FL=1